MPADTKSREHAVLAADRRRVERDLRRYQKALAAADEARLQLGATLWAAQQKGASFRGLADATGLPPTTVQRLVALPPRAQRLIALTD